jgi:hypothetical protein
VGGKAFKDVVPVPLKDVGPVVRAYVDALGLKDYRTLGSTGKKEFSGDIDIAVPSQAYDYPSLASKLRAFLGDGNVNDHGRNLNQVYTRYATPNGPYQVDLMLGDISLLEFTHMSPSSGASKYSGSHRTELLKSVAKAKSHWVAVSDNRMVARFGPTLHLDRGLVIGARWCPPRKDGNGYTAKMAAVASTEFDLFRQHFPDCPLKIEELITQPKLIKVALFDSEVEVNSYEDICFHIREHRLLSSKSDLIWQLYSQRLDSIKIEHPERLI